MGDFEGAWRTPRSEPGWTPARWCMRLRTPVFVALTAVALVACGRSELTPPWSDELGGTMPSGGALTVGSVGAAVPAGSQAGAPVFGRGGSLGHGGTSGNGGGAGSSLGGGAGLVQAGDAGTGGVHTLEVCDPALIPHLDDPPALKTQGSPDASVAGDWNRDGKLDLAVSNSDGSVSVLLGNGDGSFDTSVAYTSGLEALLMRPAMTQISTSDLDGNGTLDLVISNRDAHWLSVLLGAADGTFATGTPYSIEGEAYAIALGDFDGDGITDISAASFNGAVSVLLGHGDGSFGAPIVTTIGDNPRSMVAADLNHDGRLDVVTLGYSELAVLLGKGDGRFVKAQVYETYLTNYSVSLEDFNADGYADLALTITCGMSAFSVTGVEIFLGHGDGSFANRVSYQTRAACLDRIAVADLNGDGSIDVLTSPSSALLGNGDGSFAPETEPSTAAGGYLLGLGDWNGDGKLDVATESDHWIAVHLGNGDGSFGFGKEYATAVEPGALTLLDLDRDDALDAVAASYDSRSAGNPDTSKVSVLRGAGDGTFLTHTDYPLAWHYAAAAVADLNGDAWPDLVTRNGSSTIGVLLNTGNAQFAPEVRWEAGSDVVAVAVGDINGDGQPDVVSANGWPGSATLLFGRGDGTLSPGVSLALAARATDLALIDANGDTKLDIAVVLGGAVALSVLRGYGDGTFEPDWLYKTPEPHGRIAAADVNADGHVDLITWGAESLSIHMGAGDGSIARRLDYAATANELLVADFNLDGHPDLVMTDVSSGFTILFGAGDGTFTCSAQYAVGSLMQGLGVGDLNRDGRMDVATTTYAGLNVFLNRTH